MTDVDIPAFIPLSLLEAIRSLDTPVEDGLDELSPEIATKRLGLSATVAAQIERYRGATERNAALPFDEAVSVFRLVGRRPDAALVFADAGRRASRYATRGIATHTLMKVAPSGVGRRLVNRSASRVARDAFAAAMRHPSAGAEATMDAPLSIAAWPAGEACGFYSAALTELLRTLTGFEGTVRHEACRGRGDRDCIWRAVRAEEYQ